MNGVALRISRGAGAGDIFRFLRPAAGVVTPRYRRAVQPGSKSPRRNGMAQHEGQQADWGDLKIGLMGLGIGLVWILIVSAIAYWLAAGH
jgi:hypothetical protein